MAAQPPIGIGIIGTGTIAQSHLQSLQGFATARVASVFDVLPERAQATAQQFQVPHVASSLEELLARDDVDAVIVCTPPAAHAEPTIAALEAGKHVLCEKPFAVSPGEAERMVITAERVGKFLACASARDRFRPGQQAARALIDRGELGDVYHVRATSLRFRGRPGHHVMPQSAWFLDQARAGGGVIADFAVYSIDLVLWLLGNPQVLAVMAQMRQFAQFPPPAGITQDVEDHCVIMMQCAEAKSAIVEVAWIANMRQADGVFVLGTKAGLRLDPLTKIVGEPIAPGELPASPFLGTDLARPVEIQMFPFGLWGAPQQGDVTRPFVESVAAGRQPATPGRDALAVTRIIDAAYRSVREQRSIALV